MRLFAVALFVLVTTVVSTSLCHGVPSSLQDTVDSEFVLSGRLLLPPGNGSRGVEVVVSTTEAGNEPRDKWLLFDEEGRFSGPFTSAHLPTDLVMD